MRPMQTWRYSLTEYDPEQPWRILSVRNGMGVELDDEAPFWEWAYEHWPTPRYSVELAPMRSRGIGRIVK